MKRNVHILLMLVVVVSAIVLYEIEYLSGGISAAVMIAAASSALLFSMAHKPEAVMASEGEETLEVKALGTEWKARGTGLLSKNGIIVALACVLVWGLYKHHIDNDAKLDRVIEVMMENTYVLSLTQEQREKLEIRMPDSLRRKMRNRVND